MSPNEDTYVDLAFPSIAFQDSETEQQQHRDDPITVAPSVDPMKSTDPIGMYKLMTLESSRDAQQLSKFSNSSGIADLVRGDGCIDKGLVRI